MLSLVVAATGCRFGISSVATDGGAPIDLAVGSGGGGGGGAGGGGGNLGAADLAVNVDMTATSGLLSIVSIAAPPVTATLTLDGASGWAHWGLVGTEFDHKASDSTISDVTAIGAIAAQDTSWTSGFTWTDGTPTTAATSTQTAIKVAGQGNGLTFTVAADTTLRTAKLYLGIFKAQGSFTFHLSDGSAPDVVSQSLTNMNNSTFALYTIQYRAASAGQTLGITVTDFNELKGGSYVSLAAISIQ